jgi:uncharacterized protein (DUF4415 family)
MKRSNTSKKSELELDPPEWTPAMFARSIVRKGLKPVRPKALMSLRIDADVIEWFKAHGPGYQSRMNALLRAYMEAHPKRKTRKL